MSAGNDGASAVATSPTPAGSKKVEAEAKRLSRLLLVGVVAIWPPLFVGHLLLGSDATTMLMFGSLVGFINTVAGGRRLGAGASVIFILAAPVGLVAGQDPLAGTCLMAIACLAVGTSAYWKRYGGFNVGLVGLLFIIASPAATAAAMSGGAKESRYLLAVLIGTAVCAFWPVVLAPLMHIVRDVSRELHYEKPDTVRYVIAMTAAVSAATFYTLAFARDSHGVWLPLTLLMVLQVAPGATRRRASQRMWGTIGGALFAAVAATVVHQSWILLVLGLVMFMGLLASMGREPYSVFAFFLTTVVLLGVSTSEPAIEASLQRVAYTLIGGAIALILYGVGQMITTARHSGDHPHTSP